MTKIIENNYFLVPQESIDSAREAIDELDASIGDFFNRAENCGIVVDKDPKTGNNIYKFKVFVPLPRNFRRKSTEALTSIKNSFDQSIYAATLTIGKKPRGNLHFPWKSSLRDFDMAFDDNPKGRVPAEFRAVCLGQEPYFSGEGYPGGDDQIRELAQLANPAKHTVGLSMAPVIGGIRPPQAVGLVKFYAMPLPKWDPYKQEIVLAIISPEAKVDTNCIVMMGVIFKNAPRSQHLSVTIALSGFADKAQALLERIKTECAAILV